MQSTGWVWGTLILAFRLFTIVLVVSAIREAWRLFSSKSEALFIERLRSKMYQDPSKEDNAPNENA